MTSDSEKLLNSENAAALLALGLLGFALVMSGAIAKIIEGLEPHSATIVEAAENYPKAKRIEEAGWLPHPTFPIHLLGEYKDDIAALNEAVKHYYSDSWESVRTSFEEQLGQRGIDAEAKRHFRQMFEAHGLGLHALVPRAVFPELERIWRQKFDDNPRSKVTSQDGLMKALGEQLSLADASPRGIYGFHLLNKLCDHVFKHVDDLYLPIVQSDPVPNRHAALHGYVVYDTAQSSLNALIMADYILHLFDVLDTSMSGGDGNRR